MKSKSQKLAAKIEALNAELAAAKQAEADAADRELLKLIHKANCREEVIGFMRHVLDQQRTEKATRSAGA
jgi:hypothetical protein